MTFLGHKLAQTDQKVKLALWVITQATTSCNDIVTFWCHKVGQTDRKGDLGLWGHQLGQTSQTKKVIVTLWVIK